MQSGGGRNGAAAEQGGEGDRGLQARADGVVQAAEGRAGQVSSGGGAHRERAFQGIVVSTQTRS